MEYNKNRFNYNKSLFKQIGEMNELIGSLAFSQPILDISKQIGEINKNIGATTLSPALLNFSKQIREMNMLVGRVALSQPLLDISKQFSEMNKIIGSTVLSPSILNLSKQLYNMNKQLGNVDIQFAMNRLIDISNTIQKAYESNLIFPKEFSEINLSDIDFNDKDIEKIQYIISHENIEIAINEELVKRKSISKTKSYYRIIFLLFHYLLILINGLDNSALFLELANKHLLPVIESNLSENGQIHFSPFKQTVNQIEKIIKIYIPVSEWSFIGIVIKKGLAVYTKKRKDSIIKGKLKSPSIIKIIEQDRNWIHIQIKDFDGNIILDGWTLTRYIKKIK